jgi:hypothetical protein
VVALALVRPLTVGVLAGGALVALLYLGFRPGGGLGDPGRGGGVPATAPPGPGPGGRRFNRRYATARTVEAFTARLREQVDLDALAAELLAVADQTMQPTRASLWLRPPAVPQRSR